MRDAKQDDGTMIREPAWIGKGELTLEDLDKAVFALNPGQVTDRIIDGGDAFYIAKLEQKKVGRVKAFEEEEVQAFIRRKLETDQRTALRMKEYDKLRKMAVVRMDEPNIKTAVRMAEQKYVGMRGK
jgi:parvulin-like peptidyl-prolyl isomerase